MAWRQINIGFKDHEVRKIDAEAFSNWFPTLPLLMSTTYLDGEILVQELHDQIEGTSHIEKHTIRTILKTLFDRLKYKRYPLAKESRTGVMKDLEGLLSSDLNGFFMVNGLAHSRQCFVILANLAHATNSILLAEALMGFCHHHVHDITSNEKHEYMHRDWRPALQKIQYLAAGNMFQGLPRWFSHQDYHNAWPEWRRGRMPHRRSLPWPDTRASSTPATFRRRTPDLRMIPFSAGLATHRPPLMSPVRMLDSSPLDEVEVLHYNQQQLAEELHNLKNDIATLKYGEH